MRLLPAHEEYTYMSKKWIWVFVIIGIIVAIRIALPFIIKDYVNKTLDEMEGYGGSVSDIDLHLFRGAYVIKDITIFEEIDTFSVPFVSVSRVDLSVEWGALFRGKVAGRIVIDNPVINFTVEGEKTQDGSETDWLEMVEDLMPININHFEIKNGVISFKDFDTEPNIDIDIHDLNLVATNLSNVEQEGVALPSTINATGTSVGSGRFNIEAHLNALKQIPDIDLTLTIEQVDMTALNDFIRAYTKTDVEKGTFNLYSEIIIDDGQLKGYVRPVLENLEILDWDEEKGGFLKKAWEAIAEGVKTIFENPEEEQVATHVPIEGNLNEMDLEVGIWPTIWELFRNAFIEAISKQTENSIEFPLKQEGS
jgi:uncharacterized protein involved in outer membrane biogenesis